MVRPPSATNQKTSMAEMVAARSSRGRPSSCCKYRASSTVATRWRCASTSPSLPPSASRRSTTATRSSPAPQTFVSSATGSSPLPRSNGSLAVHRLFFYHDWWMSSAWICHTVSKLPPEIVQFHRATGFRFCSALCGVSASARIWSCFMKLDIDHFRPIGWRCLSVAMVGVGLLLSAKGAPEGTLVQVPSVVFQGSFLLGLVNRAALGYDASAVGCIDGGRALQAAFGSKVLNIAGLITYVLLGLGVLGGPLSLPWGLYIIIVQRSSGKACLKDVTGVGTWRQIVYAVTLVLVVLTLLPLWDGLATQLGIGIGTPDSLDLFM